MNTLLKVTGTDKLISFYKFIYFNGPGFVSSQASVDPRDRADPRVRLPGHFEAAKYIGMSLAALFAGTLLSALWILKGLRWGWILGSVLCAVAIVGYVVSRTWERIGVPLGYLLDGALGLPVLELDVRYFVLSSPSSVARGSREDRFYGAASGPPSTRDPCYTGSAAAPEGPSKSLQNLCAKTGDP